MGKHKLFDTPSHTLDALFKAACSVETLEDAEVFMAEYVEFMREHGTGEGATDPEGTAKANIGYVLGYGADVNIVKLFSGVGAVHPIFGTSHPTPEQAFEAGVKAAKSS